MASRSGVKEPPKKRRKVVAQKQKLETVAPQPSLELLPDNILLNILSQLDITSLVQISRVCRRFHHLYTDDFIWSDVDLSTIASRLDVRKLKKIIHERLPPSLVRIKLASTSKRQSVNSAALDELFTKCTHIRAITLIHCDLTQVSSSCKLYQSGSLERVAVVSCVTPFQWLQTVRPSWPKLAHFSLSGSVKTSNADLKYIASHQTWSSSLRSLDISGCYRITNEGVKVVCESMVSLRLLDITGCVGTSEDGVERIAKLGCLRHLSISKIPLSESTYLKLPKLFPRLKTLTLTRKNNWTSDIIPLMPSTQIIVHRE